MQRMQDLALYCTFIDKMFVLFLLSSGRQALRCKENATIQINTIEPTEEMYGGSIKI